jgi:hypothetical protein
MRAQTSLTPILPMDKGNSHINMLTRPWLSWRLITRRRLRGPIPSSGRDEIRKGIRRILTESR